MPGKLRLARLVVLAAALLLAGCAGVAPVDHHRAAEANASLGADYLRKNENDRALQAFEKALGYDRNNFRANWGMAVVSARLDEPDQARRYYKKTLSIRSAPAIYNSYAVFLCEQGDTREGVAYFERAEKTNDLDARAASVANAGLCLYRANHPDEATDYFHRALKIDAGQPTALASLARIAYDQHNYMSARAFIERADEAGGLDPDQLLLAADIETALDDSAAAASYRKRYNARGQAAPRSQNIPY